MNRAQMKGTLRQARQILGQLLLDLGEEQPDPGRVARGVYRMARLLENAQTVDSGEESVFTPAALDLAGLCRAVVQQADELLSQVGVAVEIRQMPASLILSGDETLLQRMVLELLANAAAAAGRGRVVLSLQQHAGRAVLSVTDSGHGPGGQDYLRLLRPEQELLPRPGAGAGLGLDMVRQVARLHGGAVLVTPDASGRALVVGVSLPMGAVDGHAGVSAPVERGGGLSPVLLGLAEVLPSHLYSREDLE